MNIKTLIEQYKEEMKQDLRTLVSYNSIFENPTEEYPFGKVNADCLEAGLKMVEKCGMRPVNLDNYCGYGEIGEGKEVIGVLGHLDIVPAGEGWNTNPFELTEIEGKVYGRGVSDDKGALVAGAYAIRILNDLGTKFNKRVRLIMGCNEESGSLCLKHYVEKEGHIDYGFTPDAAFPGTFGEKGMISASFSSKNTKIIKMEGGSVSNVVCAHCVTEIPLGSVNVDFLQEYFKQNDLKAEIHEGNTLILDVRGVAAHASTPDLGVNAISHTMKALKEAGFKDDFVEFYNEKIGLGVHGENCGIDFKDEYGPLTFNNGVMKTENGVITGTIDIRFPVTMQSAPIIEVMQKNFESEKGVLNIRRGVEPLFYPKDSALVQSLLAAYQEVTHDDQSEPTTMGGGTYAKGINNCIAFGCEFVGDDNHIHDANEVLPLDQFWLQVEIYAQAILNLLAL